MKTAKPERKEAIRAKIQALRQKAAAAKNKVLLVSHQVTVKKVAKLEAKLATATDPKRIKALKKLLKATAKVAALKEKLLYASPAERKAIKVQLKKAQAK